MNNDIANDGTVRPLVTIKKPRKVIGHIEPIKAKDIKFGPTLNTLSSKETPELEKPRPEIHYKQERARFLTDLEELITNNQVFNTHRIPEGIIASHMAEAAHQFNKSLFLHNTAVAMKDKE